MNLRRLFLYFILSSFCILPLRSQDPREKEMTSWDRVEHLLEQGRPASALPIAESLLRSAKARGHTADVVKALFYVFRCKEEFTEDSYLEFLRIIDQEIASAPEPLRQLLWSVRAQLLYTYFRDFLWQIKSRSPLADTIQKDIRFWDERRFRSEVYRNLWNSLQNPTLLKQVPQEKVQELLTGDKQLFYIYPTLYDFLAFRALDFLLGTDAPSEDDIEQISLANPRLWGPSEEFLQVPLPESGSNSPINAAFLLLKELTAFHLRSANLNALTAVDLKRFKFLNKYGTMARKPWYYKQALTRIITARPTILHTAEVGFELAAWYQTHGQSWKPAFNKAPDSTAFYLYNAAEVCRKVIKAFPKSPGAKKCKNLLEQILDSHLNLVIPSHTRQGKPTLACLQYKNLTQCVVTVLSCRPEEYDKFYQDDNPYYRNRVLRFLSGLRSVHRIDLTLPKDTLMHSHATYFKIPPLEPGYYIIVCAQGSDPLPQDRSLGFCYKPIISSDVVWFCEKWKQAIRIGVWNSLTDKPAKGTSIKVFRQEYDYPRRRYEDVLISEGITNEKGYFTFKYSRPYPENLKFVMYRQGIPIEVLKTWNNAPRTLLPESERVTFFTDRSLYRPGQTVHFKAVVTSGEPMPRTRLLPEYTIQVQLKDPNGRVLYDQEHTTGKMGSFWGQIILPTSGLTGLYTLMAGKSHYTFRVEEYKRPRFEVKLSPVKPEGLLGEEVRVRGTCVTLAGVPVTGVPVAIRVTRRLSPKMWRLSGPLPERQREETLVVAGTLQPNDSGSFYIHFKALPDDRYLADSTLIYEFHVQAECTDLTGETRSASLSLLYSYMPYTVSLEFPKVLIKNISPLPEIHVNALNQGPVEGLIRLKVKKAFPTGRWPLHTPLPPADVRLIPTGEFVKDFPHHLNAGETDDSLLAPGPVILDTVIAIYGKLVIPRQRLEALPDGVYILEANTLPAQGAQHHQRFTVTLCSDASAYSFGPALVTISTAHEVKPQQSVHVWVATALRGTVMVDKVGEEPHEQFQTTLETSERFRSLLPPISENVEPGWRLLFTTCLDGHIVQNFIVVKVADPSRQIRLEWLNAWDTVEPGRSYVWRFRSTRGDGRPAAFAEFAAVMYDAALDRLYPSTWSYALSQEPIPALVEVSSVQKGTEGFCLRGEKDHKFEPTGQPPTLNTFGFRLISFDDPSDDYEGFLFAGMVRRQALLSQVVVQSSGSTKAKRFEKGFESEGISGYDSKDAPSLNVPFPEEVSEPLLQGPEAGEFFPGHVRRSFQETAFFIPDIITDQEGMGEVRFTVPDQITAYTIRLAGHTEDLATGVHTTETRSQKRLMVNTFVPRFLRQGDRLVFSSKITNLSGRTDTISAFLELADGETGKRLQYLQTERPLTLQNGASQQVTFPIALPYGIKALTLRVAATSRTLSDGEEWWIPVLPSEVFLTEAIPFHVKKGQRLELLVDRLKRYLEGHSPHILLYRYTVELTENPVWLVVQALPYMAEFPHECSEQLFARYFAYETMRFLARQNPELARMVAHWSTLQPEALASALEKNPLLRNILLEETPWLREARSESEQKRMLAHMIQDVLNTDLVERTARKLAQRQAPDGGWPWFPGSSSNWYITQHILTAVGRMEEKGLLNPGHHPLSGVLPNAIHFIDQEAYQSYKGLKKEKLDNNELVLWPIHIQYLLARSYFQNVKFSKAEHRTAQDFYLHRAQIEWLKQGPYLQAMLAIAFHRYGKQEEARKIITSLRERAIRSEDYGMYWKGMMQGGLQWSEHPIEAMALLMEAFALCGGTEEEQAQMQIWLLRHKQTNRWPTTKATTEACLALLQNKKLLSTTSSPTEVWVGTQNLRQAAPSAEAGTGYITVSWTPAELPPQAAQIRAEGRSSLFSWGAAHLQYFTPYSKVESAGTKYLSIDRQLWLQSAPGKPLEPVTKDRDLQVGQRLIIRLRITCSQPLDFVHIKDHRSAVMEPEDVLSAYRWRDGLGFYQSTRDAATHFFVDHMPRGTFVLEYPVRLTHAGHFSDGFAEIQCMYAPEFSARSASSEFFVKEQVK